MSGYIKLWRKLRNHPLFKTDHKARHLFQDLLGDVAFDDTVQDWRGQPVEIKRGSMMKSQREMADDYGFSRQEIRTILNRLVKYQIVKINPFTNQAPDIITVCNWDKYQAVKPSAIPTANPEPTQSQPIKKEGEEVKEGKKEREARGTRLPTDWSLPSEWRDWVLVNKPAFPEKQISVEAEKFANHWHSAPGAKGRKASWEATWRNWIQRALENLPKQQPLRTREEHADEAWFDKLKRQNGVGEYAVHEH